MKEKKRRITQSIGVMILSLLLMTFSNHRSKAAIDFIDKNEILLMYNDLLYDTSDLQEYQIITPNSTVVNAEKYIGNDPPPTDNYTEYPSAIKLKSESNYYNCHGFAWHFNGALSGFSDSNAFILNSYGVNHYVQTGCYQTVIAGNTVTVSTLKNYYSQLRIGDIVLYNSGDAAPTTEAYAHSAIITAISSNSITVKSKWGKHGVYSHLIEDCPYKDTLYITRNGGTESGECTVSVFRKNHIHSDASITPSLSSSLTYTYPSTYGGKTLCNCGRSYGENEHTWVHLHGTLYKCSLCGLRMDTSISPDSILSENQ